MARELLDGVADITFNGRFVGETRKPEELVDEIRRKRRAGLVPLQLNVAYNAETQEVRITTESGRVRRPLAIVENGKAKLTEALLERVAEGKLTWSSLAEQGVLEYLDAMEEENALVAVAPENLTKDHTHLELDPITMLGLSATLIAYPEYNRGDRINYGAKMVGQAIGLPISNFLLRSEAKANTLVAPQVPVVETVTSKIMHKYPSGQNVVVAVMCADGYNMNDAMVMNKSSVERGLFRSFYYRTYETLKKRYWGGQEDEITIPSPGLKGHRGEEAYKHLAEDGLINPETPISSDSVLVGKVSPLRFLSSEDFAADIENRRETSVTVRHGEAGVIDRVLISETTDANQMIKIRIRDERIPEVGDKFASRHGQKGVVSLLVPQEDMPFTADGMVPDIIFNPHAIPSRMTIGHLLEMLAGKAGAAAGKRVNGSAFNHLKDEEVRSLLRDAGFRDDGKAVLYDGKTGSRYQVIVFTGIGYYLKLDHMVADKIHARSRGPVTLLTKQPTEGRAKRGGLRIGEMEQQCLIGHGAVITLKERFDSDKAKFPVCRKCGLIATFDVAQNRAFCGICKDSDIVWIETSYAFKLTLDEMKAMGIYPRLVTEEI